ncbi:endonuclease/exonuclease/phosphatase family metal-dependent hydrolase [Kitasatospora sp. MAA19]|uniref:sphingomyelin phosphodiesterase n=1 Tax=Kitasatospora sp. MAA19 TaxID=3035090 RepID=UPI0024761BA8|nr:sphingomyelin phosphodiesterase [Kitasatospora sp. MAA19]MDH6703922.1 endonuclease/exonuclease/phosphatase family metal-dependent hydrolase [Kitasatospora sp. MAA19]
MLSRRTATALTSAAAAALLFGGTAPTASAGTQAGATTLSVLAFNVDLGTAVVDSTQNEQAARRTPVIEQIVRQHNADVVVLDEQFNNSSTADINSKLADLYPYRTPVVGQTCSGGGWTGVSGNCSSSWFVINGGTMILSKYPITAQYAHVFANSTYGTWDYHADKGAALVRVNKNGSSAWVVGTHLQADESDVSTDTTQSTRLGQLAEIRAWVDGIVGSSAPVLIGGDLNVEYFHGQSRGDYANAQSAVGGVLGTPATDPSQPRTTMDCPVSAWCQYMADVETFPKDYRDDLDYLGYLNAPGRPVPAAMSTVKIDFDPQAGWTPGGQDTLAPSDHYPVEATFQLN